MPEQKLYASVAKRFKRALKKFGLVEHSESLHQQVQSCYSVSRGRGTRVKLGSSHFGGHPHMPPETPWPMDGHGLMTYVAQINLKNVAENEFGLPVSGWLLFFVGGAEASGAANQVYYFDDDARLTKIIPPTGVGFVNDAYPVGETSEGLFPATPVKITPSASLPEIDYDSPIFDELRDLHIEFRMSHSRLFGHLSDDGSQIDDPVLKKYKDWILLLQVDTMDPVSEMAWWDAGKLCFLIRRSDLKKRVFSKTIAYLSCIG